MIELSCFATPSPLCISKRTSPSRRSITTMRLIIHNLFAVIFLILAQCISADAFSCTQISKKNFRYYSDNDRCGTRVSSSSSNRPLSLYKDNGQVGGIAPVYSSSVSSNSRKSMSSVNDMDLTSAHVCYSTSSPVRKISFKDVSNIFGVVADVLVKKDSIDRGLPPILEEVEEDTYDTSGHVVDEQSISVYLVDINWLKEHEQIVSKERVQKLHDAIVGWSAYKIPLLVDSRSGAILDGHHRYAVGRMMGLSRLPVVLVDYLNDDSISVDVWPECGFDCLTKEDVVEMSLSDRVYPPKTSKHDFFASFTPINVPLSKLR